MVQYLAFFRSQLFNFESIPPRQHPRFHPSLHLHNTTWEMLKLNYATMN